MSNPEHAHVTGTEDIEAGLCDIQESISGVPSGNSMDITSLSPQERRDYAEMMIKDYREPIKRINEWMVSLLSVYDAAIYGLQQDARAISLKNEGRQENDYESLHELPGEYTQKLGLDEELGEDIWTAIINHGFSNAPVHHEDDAAYRELIAWDCFQRVMSLAAVRNGALAVQIGYYKSQADIEIQNVPQEYRVLDACWQQARVQGINEDFPAFVLKIMGPIIDNARAVQDTSRLPGQER